MIIEKYTNISDNKITNKLLKYSEILIEYNKKVNLTGEKYLNGFILNQLIDSLQAYEYMKNLNIKSILDIGTGGGLPRIPLSILLNNFKFYLEDSKFKKTEFLEIVKKKLNLKNITIINKNIPEIQNKFDIITAKAFASIEKIIKLTKNSRHKNTLYFLFKGKLNKINEELNTIKNKIQNINIININNIYTNDLHIERNFVLFNVK